jgi:hypothetical protein
MFSRTFGLTILGAVFAATLLLPVAHADSWARDNRAALDPAIATTIRDRAAAETAGLDPAIANAMREQSSISNEPMTLDPAIQIALDERAASATRPDDRNGARGVGSLKQPATETTSAAFDVNIVSVGTGLILSTILLGFGSLMVARHGRARATNA